MRLLLGSLLSTVMACGTFVSFTPLNPSPRPLRCRPAASVELYSSAPPNRPHVDVGTFEVEQTHSLNPEGRDLMYAELRETAGAHGCDAVFLGNVSDHTAQKGNPFDQSSTKLQATCIVFTDVPPERDPVGIVPPPRVTSAAPSVSVRHTSDEMATPGSGH
jgi:hypothetical protein